MPCRTCPHFGDQEECKLCFERFAIERARREKLSYYRIPYLESDKVQSILRSGKDPKDMAREILQYVRFIEDVSTDGIVRNRMSIDIDLLNGAIEEELKNV